jgi:flagellar protein FlaI
LDEKMALKVARPLKTFKIIKRMKRGYVSILRAQSSRAAGMQGPQGPQGPPGMAGRTDLAFIPMPYQTQEDQPVKPSERIDEEENLAVEGISISEGPVDTGSIPPIKPEERTDTKSIRLSYPLIPRHPAQGQKVYAYADIRWSRRFAEPIYYLVEPSISKMDKEVITATKSILEEKLDIDFFKLGEIKAKAMLREEINNILLTNPNLDRSKIDSIAYNLERDIVGLGRVEPFMHDPNIEDISCDGINIPMYVYHRNPDLGSLKTNVVFNTQEELDSFVVKISQRAKKSISIAEPLLDASLPDGSRIQATLGTDIARKGSNFTIRKFAEEPLTPSHMLRYGSLNSTQLAYLWMAIDSGQSVLISGGTATGKTSLLNALSLFIRPNLKIVSIEDTPELRLPHPHWIPEVARTPITIKESVGEVTLFDLLKSSLRQRPDYIVMGEVRGKEAFVLFQQMATGHPSIATIHAASINQLIDRLTTPPISLPPSLIENVNIIIFLSMSRLSGKYVRRANRILEVAGVKGTRPLTNTVFKWIPESDNFEIKKKSIVLHHIADRHAFTKDEVRAELFRRKLVVEWMFSRRIFNYSEVARIISAYYTSPERVMNIVGEGS